MEEIEIKKMKNKKYHIVGKNLNSKRKIAERGQIDTLSTQIQYMTAHFPGLVQTLQLKSGGAKL